MDFKEKKPQNFEIDNKITKLILDKRAENCKIILF